MIERGGSTHRTAVDPHRPPPYSLAELGRSLWRNRELVRQMVRREIAGRYRGSIMGVAWSFVTPAIMLAVYTFVFSEVFKARWGTAEEQARSSFAVALFVGMIVHGLCAECINRAPTLILGNVNYVTKVVFPLEILPWVAMGTALFHAAISVGVLLAAQLALGHGIPATALGFPAMVLPLVLLTMGLVWLLAALGVYLRDIGQLTAMLTNILLFLSPVFYPVAALPEPFRGWIRLNPLTYLIEESRALLIYGRMPDWREWGALTGVGLIVAWIGFAWFQKSRKGFADVL